MSIRFLHWRANNHLSFVYFIWIGRWRPQDQIETVIIYKFSRIAKFQFMEFVYSKEGAQNNLQPFLYKTWTWHSVKLMHVYPQCCIFVAKICFKCQMTLKRKQHWIWNLHEIIFVLLYLLPFPEITANLISICVTLHRVSTTKRRAHLALS